MHEFTLIELHGILKGSAGSLNVHPGAKLQVHMIAGGSAFVA